MSQRPFQAILERPRIGRALLGSTLAVLLVYGAVLLVVLEVSPRIPSHPVRVRRDLVVTLLDAPRVGKLRSLGELGGGSSGDAARTENPGLVVKTTVAEPSRRNASTRASAHSTSTHSRTRRGAGTTVQTAKTEGEPVATPTSARSEAPAAQTPATAGQGTHATGAGGTGGTGTGSGLIGTGSGSGSGGSGSGAGAGTKPGLPSGDTEVLPFLDGMKRPVLVSKVDPLYTREARDANVEGTILAKCVIGTDGALRRCRIMKGLPLMDEAVLRALSQWRYTPVLYQGRPAAVEYLIPVRLVLP